MILRHLENGDEVNDEDVFNLVNSASAELTILNLILSADMDMQTVANYMNENPEADAEVFAEKLNENSTIVLKTTDNQKIADGEFLCD